MSPVVIWAIGRLFQFLDRCHEPTARCFLQLLLRTRPVKTVHGLPRRVERYVATGPDSGTVYLRYETH